MVLLDRSWSGLSSPDIASISGATSRSGIKHTDLVDVQARRIKRRAAPLILGAIHEHGDPPARSEVGGRRDQIRLDPAAEFEATCRSLWILRKNARAQGHERGSSCDKVEALFQRELAEVSKKWAHSSLQAVQPKVPAEKPMRHLLDFHRDELSCRQEGREQEGHGSVAAAEVEDLGRR